MTDINNKEIIYGKRPIRRTNRKPGQSEWYYLDPRGAETFSEMKQIDVESENTPNPYANEIQNYLYNNDEYNYKLLYGDNPPPPVQVINDPNCYIEFDGRNVPDITNQLNNNGYDNINNTLAQTITQQLPIQQIVGGAIDMVSEYFEMKKHGYKNLDDYHHCKANYNAAARGLYGYNTAKILGDAKEQFDFYRNKYYKGLREDEAKKDKLHDLSVNAMGRLRGNSGVYNNAQDACADYRAKNPSFPKKYW